MLNALLIVSDFPPAFGGGISRYYHTLCSYISQPLGVVAPAYGNTDIFDAAQSFPIYRRWVPVQRYIFLRLAQALILVWYGSLVAKRMRARVLILGHWYFTFFGFIARHFFRIPFIVMLHGGELDRFRSNSMLRRIIVACIEQASAIVVNSDYTAQCYRESGGQHPRIVKIAPGIDTQFFTPSVNCVDVIHRYDIVTKRVLLTVSRLVERKGHDIVIKAMPLILQKIPMCVYLIVGSGPEEKRLRDLAEVMAVSKSVIFAGSVPDSDLPAYYNACDVFVMPSRSLDKREGIEGFGIVYLEANACGKAVIGGRSGGVSEAVKEGVNGLLVDPHDECAFAETVIGLLSDPSWAERLGSQGRVRVTEEYDSRLQASRLDQLIEMVVANVKR